MQKSYELIMTKKLDKRNFRKKALSTEGLIELVYFAKGVRKDVYEHPILYEATSGKKLGTRASRKLSIFSVLGIQRRNENGKRVSLIKAFQMLGGLGMFLGVFLVFLLVVSVAAILM